MSLERRIIVCGSRSWNDRERIREVLAEYMPDDWRIDLPTIVHGDCRGADKQAEDVATRAGFWVEAHPADWERHGKAAGPIRNREMASLGADLCIAFGDGRGTHNMMDEAQRLGIPVRWVGAS